MSYLKELKSLENSLVLNKKIIDSYKKNITKVLAKIKAFKKLSKIYDNKIKVNYYHEFYYDGEKYRPTHLNVEKTGYSVVVSYYWIDKITQEKIRWGEDKGALNKIILDCLPRSILINDYETCPVSGSEKLQIKECEKAIKEFLMESNLTLNKKSFNYEKFQKLLNFK